MILQPSEDFSIESVSGDVYLNKYTGNIKFNTISGDFDGNLQSFDNGEFNSVSGDVSINVPDDFDVNLSTNVVSGDVTCNIDNVKSSTHNLNFSTTSGDFDIR